MSLSLQPNEEVQRALHKDALVLLKDSEPAVITEEGSEKLEVLLLSKKTKKVKTKDVFVLHPGPVRSWELEELKTIRTPDAKTLENVFYLLSDSGDAVSAFNLATLMFGENTPSATWAAWKTVEQDLYFHGQPEEVYAYPRNRVSEVLAERKKAMKQTKEWDAFLDRIRSGALGPGDVTRMDDVISLALGASTSSVILKALGTEQSSENAHRLLLSLGVWTQRDNPWPSRCKVCMEPHTADVPAAAAAALPAEAGRRDLTGLTAWAIDEPGTPDPDDAISIEADGRVWVHVADVAALVTPGSPIDAEARHRGASVYLPTGPLPMLPPRATASLGMGLDARSPAMSFGFRVGEDGTLSDIEVCKSTVKATRMTYAEAHELIDKGTKGPLQDLWDVTQRRRRRREAEGSIVFQFNEADVQVSPSGEITITEIEPLLSREVVMELMLCAGEAAARFAIENNMPFIFSSQPAPILPGPPAKKQNKALQRTVVQASPPPPPVSPRTMAQMFEFRKRMQRSSLGIQPEKHHGLGLPVYSQVTSPLRRYGDLVNHQQLRAFLEGKAPTSSEEVKELAALAEEGTGNAKSAERLSRQHWTLVKLEQDGAWQGTGTCVGFRKSEPGAPRIATVILDGIGLTCNVRLRQEVKLDGQVPVRLHGVRLADLRADFFHDVVPGAIYGTNEAELYRQAARARKNVGTRLASSEMRQGQ